VARQFLSQGPAPGPELEYAGQHLTAIEINGTYYGTQKRRHGKMGGGVPEGFVFSVKASRFCTNRKVLAEAGSRSPNSSGRASPSWAEARADPVAVHAATKRFELRRLRRGSDLLPEEQEGVKLRHAIEPRHESFVCAEFVELARAWGCAIVFADHAEYPMIADLTAPFVYARLQQSRADEPTGYAAADLDRWAGIARVWTAGEAPDDLPYAAPATGDAEARDLFLFFIAGAKERNPAAAQALIERLV
jgi:uncharacterized protein YecE (DUF72 family)